MFYRVRSRANTIGDATLAAERNVSTESTIRRKTFSHSAVTIDRSLRDLLPELIVVCDADQRSRKRCHQRSFFSKLILLLARERP
jgi:hypothetical protein